MSKADLMAATRAQQMAADPASTRLASANAGSGKTKVLVERVSRLLLQGTKPEKILCLTYTKAAASEMQSRLFKTLGDWSIMPTAQLQEVLQQLTGEGSVLTDLKRARRLFAEALETPEGLKVQTIHAFCERILSRFPIEAGILPGFEPIDEADMRRVKDAVREEIYRAAASIPAGELNISLQTLSAEKADDTLDILFNWMAASPDKIEQWVKSDGVQLLADEFGLPLEADEAQILAQAWADSDIESLRQKGALLLESTSKTDPKTGAAIIEACNTIDPVAAFWIYASIFLTQAGGPRKSVVTKKADESSQIFFASDGAEASRILKAVKDADAANSLRLTRAFLIIAKDYAVRFKAAKHLRRGLDFNDQIVLVRDLLKRSEFSDWIRYKLDGGIEHILLDEAQDTSPEQWEIIDALHDAFVQDNPNRQSKHPRTLFAVGDEKQSIYSFQGADPEKFLAKIRQYADTSELGEVRMRMSFRSAPEILKFVDQIFVENKAVQRMFDAADFPPASDIYTHTASRADAGQVDVWPLVDRPETEAENDPWDTRPVNALAKGDAREQLAEAIARQIKKWLETGESVFDRGLKTTRPMRAADIIVLVRKRNAFFDAVIRNLKIYSVPVAGADRLRLKDSMAVADLMSLAKFALLPSDDLSLAEVLKSPLLGYSEEDLFAVAARRGEKTLWQSVQASRPDTAEILSSILTYSRRFGPYEFFARVLDKVDGAGLSLTQKIYGRLGLEAKDAIEAFLSRALAHQRRGAPSLQQFVQDFSQDTQELKREMDADRGQVRVMTVHGAKGLEAPVVFLPDTTQNPRSGADIISVGKGYAITANASRVPQALEAYKDAAKARTAQEALRLFYVAMTRAESRLIICGYKHGRGTGTISEGCWYEDAQAAFEGLETRQIETPFGEGLAFGAGAKSAKISREDQGPGKAVLPDWIGQAAPAEPLLLRRVTPSRLLVPPPQRDMPVRSPLSAAKETRFLRGNIIHKLLEMLPECEIGQRRDMAVKMVSGFKSFSEDQRALIVDEVFAVLDHPDFADIFAEGSYAEISLAGTAKSLSNHLYLNAQIDRLSVSADKVYIVDYKSNRPPPLTQDGVAEIYWGQMAAYRELAREIYPDKEIVCALLWTDGPRLMVLDDNRLDAALTRIAMLPT